MIAGDSDANGVVNENDKSLIWKNQAGRSGYLPGDLNFDGQANNPDKNEFIIINYLTHSNIPQ
jgi:hypothetical protein